MTTTARRYACGYCGASLPRRQMHPDGATKNATWYCNDPRACQQRAEARAQAERGSR